MTHALKPYPAMKDSGVPWLGEVPEHWAVRRLKQVCTRSALYGANIPASSYSPTGIRFLRTTDIRDDGSLKRGGVYISPQDATGYVLKDGDLLISRSGTVGRSFLYDSVTHGPCAYAGYLVRFVLGASVSPRFLLYFTRTPSFADFLKLASIQSTIENVNGEKYANSILPIPPLPEQAAIVRFLDHADRRIRRYILAKQKLIKLLEEQKQAIIHRAVTRGLPAEAAAKAGLPVNRHLKPSGVEWLGDVPEHWEVQKVKHVSKLLVSNVDKISLQNEMPIRLCNYTDVYKNEVISDKINFMVASATRDEINKFKLKIGDVVITKDSEMWNDIGVPALVAYEAPDLICGYHLAILRPDDRKMRSEFLLRCFQDRLLVTQLHIQANGITRYGLSQQAIKDCLVPVPPVNDQSAICKILKAELLGLNAAKVKALREIELLREYRTRLIADVVTGKVDVRAASAFAEASADEAASLPDEAEAEGPQALDEAEDLPQAAEDEGEYDSGEEERTK